MENPNENYSEHKEKPDEIGDLLNTASESTILFEGTLDPLNITDYGNLYENNQDITLINETELNTTYFLDDGNGWQVNNISNTILNIQDTRNWINNSGFRDIEIYKDWLHHPVNCLKGSHVNEFATHIHNVAAQQPLRDQLQTNAKKLACEHDISHTVEMLASLYESLIT